MAGVTTTLVVANVSLPIGATAFGPVTPPPDLSNIQVAIDRTFLTSVTLAITLALEMSLDGGITFVPWIGMNTNGGTTISPKTGLLVATDLLRGELPVPTGANTRIRGSVVSNEVAVTTVTLTA